MINTYLELEKEKTNLLIRIENYENEKEYLQKLAKLNGPAGISGIDYTQTKVQTSGQISFMEYLKRIQRINSHLELHRERLAKVEELMQSIEQKIEKAKDKHQKVLYYRIIKGYTQEKTAELTGYSEKQVGRIENRYKFRELEVDIGKLI